MGEDEVNDNACFSGPFHLVRTSFGTFASTLHISKSQMELIITVIKIVMLGTQAINRHVRHLEVTENFLSFSIMYSYKMRIEWKKLDGSISPKETQRHRHWLATCGAN